MSIAIQFSLPGLPDRWFLHPCRGKFVLWVGGTWTLDLGKRTRSGHEFDDSRAPEPQQLLAAGPLRWTAAPAELLLCRPRLLASRNQPGCPTSLGANAALGKPISAVRLMSGPGTQAPAVPRLSRARAHRRSFFPHHPSAAPNTARAYSIAARRQHRHRRGPPRRYTLHHHGALPLFLTLRLIYKSFFTPRDDKLHTPDGLYIRDHARPHLELRSQQPALSA